MVGTECKVVLRMPLAQLRKKLDRLKILAPVLKLEWQRTFANLARHLAIGISVVFTQESIRLLLDLFPANRNRSLADFGLLVRSLERLGAHILGTSRRVCQRTIWHGGLVAVVEC